MKLSDFLTYDKITLQCHDNPDADAIASGYALYTYFKEKGKDVSLIYSGRFKMQKDNLTLFVSELAIPVEYWDYHEKEIDGLLITVDCQYGAQNVSKIIGDAVAVIDHHKVEIENENSYIDSSMGACATVVWQLLKAEGFEFEKYKKVQTALYYGLYTDTVQFASLVNPVDKDMKDSLDYDKLLMARLQNSNISARELEIAGIAMIRAIINKEKRFAVVKAEPCDPNILGLISDFVLQVSEIDVCIVFNIPAHGIKYSVRSCIREAMADHIARVVSQGIGSGGGHNQKAGGYIAIAEYNKQYGDVDEITYFANKLRDYLDNYQVIDTEKEEYKIEGAKKYRKKELTVGYVKATDIIPVNEPVTVRTLEGDLHITVKEDTYIMIGVKGEVYPISEANFRKNYKPLDETYNMQLEYHPKAKLMNLGREYSILDYAKTCKTTTRNIIYAKPLTEKGVKIFTQWDRDCYMLGEVGDYFACKEDNLNDMYVIERSIFGITYEEIE